MLVYHDVKHCFKQGVFRLRIIIAAAAMVFYAISATTSMAAASGTAQCDINPARLETLRSQARGPVAKLLLPAQTPWYAGDLAFQDAAGKDLRLADFKGKTLLVNLWAVWCAPCREEMPELAALYEKMHGADFDVVAINIDRKPEGKVPEFLQKVGAESLPLYLDKSMATFNAARQQGLAYGLPFSLLVDKEGCLLATFTGSAPWGGADARAFIQAVLNAEKSGRP